MSRGRGCGGFCRPGAWRLRQARPRCRARWCHWSTNPHQFTDYLGHPEIDQLGIPTLGSLRAYLRNEVAAEQQTPSAISNFRADSRAEQIVFEGMRDSGLKPYPKLNVAGYKLDFTLLDEGID